MSFSIRSFSNAMALSFFSSSGDGTGFGTRLGLEDSNWGSKEVWGEGGEGWYGGREEREVWGQGGEGWYHIGILCTSAYNSPFTPLVAIAIATRTLLLIIRTLEGTRSSLGS